MNNKIKIKVIGKNINRFIIKLHNKKINIYNIIKKNNDIAYLIIDYKAYDDIIKYKTYYDIYIIDYLGPLKLKKIINKNKYYLLLIIISLCIVYFLTHLTFKINIITNDIDIKNKLIKELKDNGIYKYSWLKSYNEITKVKNNILNKYPDLFEWLEIKRNGTSYYVRFDKRLTNDSNKDINTYDIVSSKDARIISLNIDSGKIIKNINEYVKKGDIIVTSDITLNDEIKGVRSAKGTVYGEVWYKVSIKLPNNYQKEELSGKHVNTYSLNFISTKIYFDKSNFNDKIDISIPIIKNSIFPISISKDTIKEVITSKNISREELAIELCLEKIKEKLKDNEEVIDYFVIEKNKNDHEFNLSLFISVKEQISVLVAR